MDVWITSGMHNLTIGVESSGYKWAGTLRISRKGELRDVAEIGQRVAVS